MGYEIDFIPVGEGEKSGDAICLRFGNLYGKREEYKVVVVDAGFKESGGKDLVSHIKRYYYTSVVDLAISSHPDSDHVSGLEVVLNGLDVKELWMHQPWKHTADLSKLFKDDRVTDKSVKEALKKSLDDALDLEKLATSKKIPIKEPFTGLSFLSSLYVIGPSKDLYESLLPGFKGTPEPVETLEAIFAKYFDKAAGVVKRVAETLDLETLNDQGETTAENNTSTVLILRNETRDSMLTSDAGIPAFNEAINYLDYVKYNYSALHFVQVPHHGSQRNIGPNILNKLIGPKLREEKFVKTAFVSIARDSDSKHPSKKVTNAFRRRGAPVHATSGLTKWYHHNAPKRDNFSTSTPLPFYNEVED